MCPMPSFERLNRRYGPWVSLALGVAAVVYVRRGLGFAPVAISVLMLAWIGAAALRRLASGTGTGVHERALVGAADAFPNGTERVYVWFAVAVPVRYRQAVRFEWYRDGEPAGRVIEMFVVGGRREGFRIWSSRAAPAPGRWRVDLRTDSSQLIARESFVVR